jgi:hypothetical protein
MTLVFSPLLLIISTIAYLASNSWKIKPKPSMDGMEMAFLAIGIFCIVLAAQMIL